jgi:hypothetical protein
MNAATVGKPSPECEGFMPDKYSEFYFHTILHAKQILYCIQFISFQMPRQ